MSVLVLCKFTPLGFETKKITLSTRAFFCVNLPRWGLKQTQELDDLAAWYGVNLPRWGLKLGAVAGALIGGALCKFTPLGFETQIVGSS